jgi:hypothetical protein
VSLQSEQDEEMDIEDKIQILAMVTEAQFLIDQLERE